MNPYLPAVMNIAEICAQLGVAEAVISPGSRSAPLALAFARHPRMHTRVVIDERCAAFVALGIAQATGRPVALVCTSGTAPLNYGPGVAEAHYQQLPLILFTADRPPEWIDQQDGQTIVQPGMYQGRVKHCYSLPVDTDHPDAAWQMARSVAEAVNLADTPPRGPVHLNLPFREPFYPTAEQSVAYGPVRVIRQTQGRAVLEKAQWEALLATLEEAERVLVVAGQHNPGAGEIQALETLNLVTVGDIVSNLHGLPRVIRHPDSFLGGLDAETAKRLRPGLLISFGQSVVSKNLKLFLRAHPPREHWHVQLAGPAADTFQCLTRVIRLDPADFLATSQERLGRREDDDYMALWQGLEQNNRRLLAELARDADFHEFSAVQAVLAALPDDCVLHLGNSMAVRHGNFIGLSRSTVRVRSNRGTAGIEGSMSTAVGHSLADSALNVLLLGDLSFFYDRNALWSGPVPANLRIVLLNNQGGGIFDLLPDASHLPERDEFFLTRHELSAETTARDFELDYRTATDHRQLTAALGDFFSVGARAGLLEIRTDIEINSRFFRHFKQQWRTLCQNPLPGKP
mgnify:CR=1 FL=1